MHISNIFRIIQVTQKEEAFPLHPLSVCSLLLNDVHTKAVLLSLLKLYFALRVMSSSNEGLVESVQIYGISPSVPVFFPVGADGCARISGLQLAMRFHFTEGTLHVDKEVFDPITKELTHTVAQISIGVVEDEHWILKAGKYRIYGMKSCRTAIIPDPLASAQCSKLVDITPLLSKVKLEPQDTFVQELSKKCLGHLGVNK